MPIGNGTAGAVGSPLPKWQLALVVGAPVALGLGYMYYRNNASKPDRDNKTKGSRKVNGTSSDKQISIDAEYSLETSEPKKPESLSDRAQRHKNLGNTAFKSGKYDEAIGHYNKAIEACPESNKGDLATFYQNRAAAYEQLKKYSAVKDDCTKALELKPMYVKALIRRARALERMDELELVLEDVTTACILEQFQNQSTIQMADRVLKQLGKQHAQKHLENKIPVMPSKYFINTYFSSFRRYPVVSEMDATIEGNEFECLERAKQALTQEKYDDIIPICTEEITKLENVDNPVKMQLVLLRATFYTFLGQHEAAMTELETIVNSAAASNAVKVHALINRASLFMQLENHEKCFEDYELAINIDPECSDIYYHRGQMNLLMDKIDEAKEDCETAVKLNPTFGVGHAQKCYTDYRYAVTKRSFEFVTAALKSFEKAIEMFPDCGELHTLYAQVLTDTSEYEKADKHFAQAITKDPKNSTIYVHRCLLQLQWDGNVEKAVGYVEKALEVDDKSGFGYETLATIQVQRGKLKEAIELFDKALALSRTATELTHLFSLQDAAKAQLKITERLGSNLSLLSQGVS